MKFKAKITQNKAIISAILLLLVAVIASVTAVYAWIVNPTRTRVTDTKLAVVGDNVALGREITLSRTLGSVTQDFAYRQEDGAFYLYENGAFVLDGGGAKQPLALRAIGNGERLTLTLTFKSDEGYDKFNVFFRQSAAQSFTHNGVKHSALGALRYYDEDADKYVWLAEYGPEGDTLCDSKVVVKTGVYSEQQQDSEGYATVSITFVSDLSQVEALGADAKSLLQLSISIGSVGVSAERKSA